MRVIHGDCLRLLASGDIPNDAAIVSDPPYGMKWNTDSTRFTGGKRPDLRPCEGRDDWGVIAGDSEPFDPSPWLAFRKVVLFGANHYAQRLPVGTTLVWIKKNDTQFGTFLSDAEVAWMKGGHGVYCFRKLFQPPTRAKENDGKRVAHPTQKPVDLMRWCIQKPKLPANSLIVDPYCGSGSTGVAAILEGHRFLGVEREESYVAIARQRIADAEAQLSLGVA